LVAGAAFGGSAIYTWRFSMLEGDSSAPTQNVPKKSNRTVVLMVIAMALGLVALIALNMN
jgi:uncharacterized iron-regulated membrane protein